MFDGVFTGDLFVKTRAKGKVKDLRVFANLDLDKSLLLDFDWKNIYHNMDNAIPITRYKYCADDKDSELSKLKDYLLVLTSKENLKKANSEYFGMRMIQEANSLEEAFHRVFTKPEIF